MKKRADVQKSGVPSRVMFDEIQQD